MDINRDNYEEYFLLYADNELTDSEKAEVLMFVKHHKDLEEEFRMIHHTISMPDKSVLLTDKSFLFRNNITAFINEKNYEEIFVLYHDNELTENEKLETEGFLSVYKELKNEFDLIGVARLTPESSVVLPNKKILYRKEKSGKVVPVMFWRMLAAAVFIGLGLWVINLNFQKAVKSNLTTANSISAKNSSQKIEKNIHTDKKLVETVAHSSDTKHAKEINDKKEKEQKYLIQKNNKSNAVVKNILTTQKQVKENSTTQLPVKINNEPMVLNNPIKDISKNEISFIDKIEPEKMLAQNAIENNNAKDEPVTNSKTDSYVTDTDNKNQNYVFYDITTTEFRKTKIGGFFKKVKRVITRSNPIGRLLSGDDRQVVSK